MPKDKKKNSRKKDFTTKGKFTPVNRYADLPLEIQTTFIMRASFFVALLVAGIVVSIIAKSWDIFIFTMIAGFAATCYLFFWLAEFLYDKVKVVTGTVVDETGMKDDKKRLIKSNQYTRKSFVLKNLGDGQDIKIMYNTLSVIKKGQIVRVYFDPRDIIKSMDGMNQINSSKYIYIVKAASFPNADAEKQDNKKS